MNHPPREQDPELDETGPQRIVSNEESAADAPLREPGWWQASDQNWYPPEQHPNNVASVRTTPDEPAASSATWAVPSGWERVRPHLEQGSRFWSGVSRQGKVGLAGGAVLVVGAAVAVPVIALHYFFAGPSLSPEQQFAHDLAVAGIVSADPKVRAGLNLPAGPESDARIAALASEICAGLGSGANKDGAATQLYQGALEGTLTGGTPLSHDSAVKIVDLAAHDVCPGK